MTSARLESGKPAQLPSFVAVMQTHCDAANLPRASTTGMSALHEVLRESVPLSVSRKIMSGGGDIRIRADDLCPEGCPPNLADVASPTPDVGASAGSVGKLDCVKNGKLNASNLRQKRSASDQIQLDVPDSFLSLTTGFKFSTGPSRISWIFDVGIFRLNVAA